MDDLPCWPRYRPIRVIGQGGFGTVYLCVDTEPTSIMYEQQVAVKAVSLNNFSDEEVLMAMSEVSLLRNIGHPNIITYYDSFLHDEDESVQPRKGSTTLVSQPHGDDIAAAGEAFRSQWLCLVTEYMDGGDLASLLRQYSGQGLSGTGSVHQCITLRTEETTTGVHKLHGSSAAVSDNAATGVDQAAASGEDWASRSRRHRQRLAATLRSAPHPPASTCSTAVKVTAMRWDGLGTSSGQTWMSDAPEAAMPATPLGATELEAAGVVRCGSCSSIRKPITTASNATVGSAGTSPPYLASLSGNAEVAAAGRASDPCEPQLPPLPNQLWLESFLITDIAKQCLDALAYLHALCIVHRDIKPSNIYVSKRDGIVKIGDFGVSKLLQPAEPFTTTFVGTPFYLCPELCLGDPYSFGADIWALGVILYELYCLKLPFTSDNVLAQIYVITEGTYDTAALSTPHAFAEPQLAVLETLYGPSFLRSEQLLHSLVVSMVSQMLRVDPAERPSAEELLTGVFGAGGTSRCGSSAGLLATSVTPTPLHRPRPTGVLACGTVSTPSQRGSSSAAAAGEIAPTTSQASLNRLGPLASEQHALWAGTLVAAAFNTMQQQQQPPATPPPHRQQGASLVSSTTSRSRCSRAKRDGVAKDVTGAHSTLAVLVKASVTETLQGMPPAQRERLGSRAAAKERGEREEHSPAMLPVSSPRLTPSLTLSRSSVVAGVRSNSANGQVTLFSLDLAGRGRAEVFPLCKESGGGAVVTSPPSLELADCTALHLLPAAPFPLEQLYDGLTSIRESSVNVRGTTRKQRTVEDKGPVRSPLGEQVARRSASASLSLWAADTPRVECSRYEEEDALDHPIGAQTCSEMMELVENIPWLKNAEVFSAIPLSAGCDNVMLVERANRSSVSAIVDDGVVNSATGNTAAGNAQEWAEDAAAASKNSHTAPYQQQPRLSATPPSSLLRPPHNPAQPQRCQWGGGELADPGSGTDSIRMFSDPLLPVNYAGVVFRPTSCVEVTTISPTARTRGGNSSPLSSQSPFQRGTSATVGRTEAESIPSVWQRRVSGGVTAGSEQSSSTPAAPRRGSVSLAALSTTVLTGTPALPASRAGKSQTAPDASDPTSPSPSLQPSGGADKQRTVGTMVGAVTSALRPWLFSSSGREPTVNNAASEARLRPVSAAQTNTAATPSASGVALPTPKARSPGRCEGYSATELEALLRRKLLAHYQRRQRKLGAQRAHHAAQEAAKTAACAKLKALYDEAFASRLGAAPLDAGCTTTYHSSVTVDGFPEVPHEIGIDANERTRAANGSAEGGEYFPRDAALATSPARAATQLPLLEAKTFAKGAHAALLSPKEGVFPPPPSVPFSHDLPILFSLDATARQAETEELALQAFSAAHARPVEMPAAAVPGTETLTDGGGERKDWLAATPAARRVREAASLAVAVEHQRAAFRHGKAPTRVHVAPPWRPPHDSRDVPGLWETSSAEEEADAAARGQLGLPAPEKVREEVRWRWSAPPSDRDDTTGTTSEDEEIEASSSRTAFSSVTSSTSTSLAPSWVSLASVSRADTLDVPQQTPKESFIAAATLTGVWQRVASRRLARSERKLGGGMAGSLHGSGNARFQEQWASSLQGSLMPPKLNNLDSGSRAEHARDDESAWESLSVPSFVVASAKAAAEASDGRGETGSASASSASTLSSTTSASHCSANHSALDSSHLHHTKGGERKDVGGSSEDDDSSADSSSDSALSSTAGAVSHSFDDVPSSTDTGYAGAEARAAEMKTESDDDEEDDMSYTYTVQLDAETGRRYFEYVCPVAVEVVGALPGGYRVVSAEAALRALDSAVAAPFSATLVPASGHHIIKQDSGGLATRMLTVEALRLSAIPRLCEGGNDTATESGSISNGFGQGKGSLVGGGYCATCQEAGDFGAAAASPSPLPVSPPSTSLVSLPPDAGGTLDFTATPGKQQRHAPATDTIASPEGPSSARADAFHLVCRSIASRQHYTTARGAVASSSRSTDSNKGGGSATARLGGLAASLHLSGAPVEKVATPLCPSHLALAALSENTTAKVRTPLTHFSSAESTSTLVNAGVLPVSTSALANADGRVSQGFLCDQARAQGHAAVALEQEIAAVVGATWRVRVPSSLSAPPLGSPSALMLSSPGLGLEKSQQQHQCTAPLQHIRLPLSLALRPLRQRTRFVGLLWRLWVSLMVSDLALRRVLLERHNSAPSPSPRCTFAEAFGDWVAPPRNADANERTGVDVSLSDEARTSHRFSRSISSTDDSATADSRELQALASLMPPSHSSPRKWGLYYVESRTQCAVQLRTDADWAVVRRKVGEMGTMLPFVRLYLLLEEAEQASE
nr:unnamed protein product [Leishmania braziliensis]